MAFVANPWSGAQRALLHVLTGGGGSGLSAPAALAPPSGVGGLQQVGPSPAPWLDILSGGGSGASGGVSAPTSLPPAGTGGGSGAPPPSGGGDVWGNPATQDSVDAWFASALVNAMGNPAALQHLLSSVNGPNGPQGSLKGHYLGLLNGVMAGDPAAIAEARHYASGYVQGGPNTPLQ